MEILSLIKTLTGYLNVWLFQNAVGVILENWTNQKLEFPAGRQEAGGESYFVVTSIHAMSCRYFAGTDRWYPPQDIPKHTRYVSPGFIVNTGCNYTEQRVIVSIVSPGANLKTQSEYGGGDSQSGLMIISFPSLSPPHPPQKNRENAAFRHFSPIIPCLEAYSRLRNNWNPHGTVCRVWPWLWEF